MNSQVNEAVLAAVAGLTLGSPHVGRNQFQRLTGYSPIPHRMTPHPSLDAWLVWTKASTENRPPESLGQLLLDGLEDHTAETAYGLMNLRRGFGNPLSGTQDNPLSDGSRALLRTLVWAFLKRNSPEEAGRFAFLDASIDHVGDGAWIPAALTFALSACPPGASASDFWNAFTDLLPSQSGFHRVAPHIRENIGHPEAPQIFANQFSSRFPGLDRTGIVASASFVLHGLMHSGQNPERAMLIAAGCGGQSDLVAGTAACVAAALWGPLPPDYISALDGSYIATHALKNISPPATLDEFAAAIEAACPEPLVIEPIEVAAVVEPDQPETVEAETSEEEAPIPMEGEAIPEESKEAPAEETPEPAPQLHISIPSQGLRDLLTTASTYISTEVHGFKVTATYLDPPLGAPPVKNLNITIANQTGETKNVPLALTAPTGWEVASRIAESALPANSATSFPAVVKPAANPGQDSQLRLQIDRFQLLIPFAAPQRYWLLGPFTNIEGTGYSQEHPPEKNAQKIQDMNQAFSGRSDLGIRWQEQFYSGTELDIEPIFNGGAGTAFLYANVVWPTAGILVVQAAYAGGLKIWIDNELKLNYNDSTIKPADHDSYRTTFQQTGESRILIKLVRGRDPIPPLRLTFFDETGRIIYPRQFVKEA